MVTGSALSVQHQLAEMFRTSRSRVVDVFREWDRDESGGIDRAEFAQAMRSLGFVQVMGEIDKLFSMADTTKSGSIGFHDLEKALHGRQTHLEPSLRCGALGDVMSIGNTPRSQHAPAAGGHGSPPPIPG